MSRDLYPSNSNIIDLRSKILSTHAPSRTKQFVNELDRLSSTSFGQKEKTRISGLAYESERWFSPRLNSEINTSLPPRRSIFTPSRLSARRTRESTKPYWRCPNPTSSVPSKNITASLDVDGFFNKATPVGNVALVANTTLLDNIASVVDCSPVANSLPVNNTASQVSDVHAVNATFFDTASVENDTGRANAIASGVDAAESCPAFTFAEAVVREPKCPSPPPMPKPTYQDKGIQTEEVQPVTTPKEKQSTDKPSETATLQNSVNAPLVCGFQLSSAPLNGGFNFGTSTSEATDSTMVIDSNVNGLITMNGVSEFAPCAPVGSGYQFAAPLSGGVFHFGTSTSEASNNSNFCDGLTNRSNVPVRKMLHAKRMKKR